MDIKKITEANRLAWNEVAPIHRKARKVNLTEEFRRKSYSTLDEIVTSKLKELSIEGKDVAQLCCNNGREVLSISNLGAGSAVGFDISDEAIKEARELADVSGLSCEFVRVDVYDIGDQYHEAFGLVFVSVGALSWLPDLARFFGIVHNMLRKDGIVVIYEHHPFLYVLATEDDDEFDAKDPLKVAFSYFRKEPWISETGVDYIGKSKYKAKANYSYTQTMSDIMNSMIENGISIIELVEYPHDISEEFHHLEKLEKKLPLCYILVGRKTSI
jgi:SAM-dependent methyltransferase